MLDGIGEISDNVLLFTADVVGLYPNILHNEGLEMMRQALHIRTNPSVSTVN